jgi:parvulin-like peptidyl-prolyl isomerase
LKNLSTPAALLLGAVLIIAGAVGQRYLVMPGLSPADSTPATQPADGSSTGATSAAKPAAATALDARLLGEVLSIVDAPRRSEILNSADVFKQFVQQETLNQAVLKAAYTNKADDNPQIRTVMERAGQRVLVESYLNQVVRVNLDSKFPSEEQVREAYDKNPDAFRVPERVHLWQIFIPLDPAADDTRVKAAWARANRVSDELRGGKGDFAALAKRDSGHEASRVNDGYMGLLKSADLLPPIAEALKKLRPGQVSEPIASESGLHILKRGATVDAEMLDFERVREQLRSRMVQEAMAKVRQAAIDKIEKEYPVEAPSVEVLENWRQDLIKQATPPVTNAPPAAPAAAQP